MSPGPEPFPCPGHPGTSPVLRKSPLSGALVYYACPVRGCQVSGWSSADEPTARDSWQRAVHGGPLFSAGVLAFLALPASAGTLGGPGAGSLLGYLPNALLLICALCVTGALGLLCWVWSRAIEVEHEHLRRAMVTEGDRAARIEKNRRALRFCEQVVFSNERQAGARLAGEVPMTPRMMWRLEQGLYYHDWTWEGVEADLERGRTGRRA